MALDLTVLAESVLGEKDIENALKRLETWEEFVSAALMARDIKEKAQWLLGKIAKTADWKYGENSTAKLAREIGISVHSLRAYKWVVSKFPNEYKPEGHLGYSYHRLAAGTENPTKTINHITNENLTYDDAERFVKGKPLAQECEHDFKPINIVECTKCGKTKRA